MSSALKCNDDIFRLIEAGDSKQLRKMLSAHFSDLNRSVIRASENTSDNSGDVQTFKDKVTCMRNDRHYSALVYASYTG